LISFVGSEKSINLLAPAVATYSEYRWCRKEGLMGQSVCMDVHGLNEAPLWVAASTKSQFTLAGLELYKHYLEKLFYFPQNKVSSNHERIYSLGRCH